MCSYTHVHMNMHMQQAQDAVGVLVIYSQHRSVQGEEGFPMNFLLGRVLAGSAAPA